ncbi:hypothetical protein GUITHDRAFT_143735 [Guillardia theta CCMP2712]|uniref:Uncharacterized protein n=1 Tax=Guillardia theta (strain CCMP2712) TaxID=905079 RepID=L1ISB1_GUITC|nr:hypothetical protein GUITHDRAFT_143735 [Guillardia theta CCMP2712]EKX39128.1 hypothetical protein GUITHDRAFT_143735 [Guillardia theta CCMP2712]|mmetsp:Transcript_1047/g.3260  ORF Transcript_1047/g.3260 Transcript_1047/m.3260 type:complete len:264 (+) Transcript_1047:258-1049(+)|eukprot:XP_005826108.1 hypothetical protein GUITHDRAFT_143735 [Guillardia theta CCMP2712]
MAGGDAVTAREKMQKMSRSSFKRKCAENGIVVPLKALERNIARSPAIAREVLAYRTRNKLITYRQDTADTFTAVIVVHDGERVEAAGDPSSWPPHTIERVLKGELFLAQARLGYGREGITLGRRKGGRTLRLRGMESLTLSREFCDELSLQLESSRRPPMSLRGEAKEERATGALEHDGVVEAVEAGRTCNGDVSKGVEAGGPRAKVMVNGRDVEHNNTQHKENPSLAACVILVLLVIGLYWIFSDALWRWFQLQGGLVPFVL